MAHQPNRKRHPNKNRNKRTRKNRKPNWIYPGDLCWFEKTQVARPADVDEDGIWTASQYMERVLYSDEPIIYVRRTRLQDGTVVHHIESLGLKYVFMGTIDAFNKRGPVRRPDWLDEAYAG